MRNLFRSIVAAAILAIPVAVAGPAAAQTVLTVRQYAPPYARGFRRGFVVGYGKGFSAAGAKMPFGIPGFYSGIYTYPGGVYFYDPGTVLFFKELSKVI